MKTVSIATRKKNVIFVVSVDDDDDDDEHLFHATVYKFSSILRVIMTSTCAVLPLEGGRRRKSAGCLITLRWLQMFQNAGTTSRRDHTLKSVLLCNTPYLPRRYNSILPPNEFT